MPDSGKDLWNSLLETLGVPSSEPPPAPPRAETVTEEPSPAPAKPQPVSMLRPEKSKAPAKPKPAKPAAKSPSYWSRIAGALGLESAAPSEPAAEAPEQEVREEAAPEVSAPSFARHEESPPARGQRAEESTPRGFDRPRREERRPREERQPREERRPREEHRPREEDRARKEREEPAAPPQHSLSDMFGKKQPDVNVFGLGLDDEATESTRPRAAGESSSRAEESGAVLDYDRPASADLSFETPPAGERSLDEEGEAREGRRRRRRRGRGRGRGRGDEQTPHPAERHESDIEPAGEDADFDFDRDEELDIDADLGDQPPPSRERTSPAGDAPRDFEAEKYPPRGERPVRHREERGDRGRDDDRRGGRSVRGRGDRSPTSRESGHARGDERDAPRPARGPRRAPRQVVPQDDEPDDDLRAANMEDDDDAGEGGLPTHKQIPTWDEAVNLLIDANMASRDKDPDRGGRGRGRGRGR